MSLMMRLCALQSFAGVTTRLTNHSSTAGVTDCVNQIPGLLIGSCFDLANGESKINRE